MSWQTVVLSVVAAVVVAVVWMGRYQLGVVDSSRPGIAFRMDRWTGQVVFIRLSAGATVTVDAEPERSSTEAGRGGTLIPWEDFEGR